MYSKLKLLCEQCNMNCLWHCSAVELHSHSEMECVKAYKQLRMIIGIHVECAP